MQSELGSDPYSHRRLVDEQGAPLAGAEEGHETVEPPLSEPESVPPPESAVLPPSSPGEPESVAPPSAAPEHRHSSKLVPDDAHV